MGYASPEAMGRMQERRQEQADAARKYQQMQKSNKLVHNLSTYSAVGMIGGMGADWAFSVGENGSVMSRAVEGVGQTIEGLAPEVGQTVANVGTTLDQAGVTAGEDVAMTTERTFVNEAAEGQYNQALSEYNSSVEALEATGNPLAMGPEATSYADFQQVAGDTVIAEPGAASVGAAQEGVEVAQGFETAGQNVTNWGAENLGGLESAGAQIGEAGAALSGVLLPASLALAGYSIYRQQRMQRLKEEAQGG